LTKAHYSIAGLYCKSWDAVIDQAQPPMDFVFTVCDAAAELCPTWPGQPMLSHWSIPDPAACTGSAAEQAVAFADAFRMLFNRITIFVNLPLEALDKLALQSKLDGIGQLSAIEPKRQIYAQGVM
jgi:hypothetical protein